MHPVLFYIPIIHWPVNSYGLLVALGFLSGMWWVGREAKRVGENPERATDLAFYIVVAAIVGSRLLHVLVEAWDEFAANPLYFFQIWRGGLVFYGGLIASLVVGIWYFRKYRLNGWIYSDIFAPAISLGHAIGRLGCFMAGCCYGRESSPDAWYSIIFPHSAREIAPAGVPLYPTQLMESAGEFVIFLLLFSFRKHKRFNGQIIAMYFILYSILRTAIEFFRGDVDRGYAGMLSTSQWISVALIMVGIVVWIRQSKKGRLT